MPINFRVQMGSGVFDTVWSQPTRLQHSDHLLPLTTGAPVKLKNKMPKGCDTLRASQTVPHSSTNRALCRLTSEFRWDRVNTSQCGRWRIPGVEYSRGEFLKIMLTGTAYTYYFMTLQHISVKQIEKTHSICLLRFSMP